ncbi:MAG: hypothetical protein ACTSYN_00295 [Candidatus Heimdallarchaeaceae archaeon]
MLKFKSVVKSLGIMFMWSLIVASVVTPRIFLRLEYASTHGWTEPYMLPILDWPQYIVLCFSTFLMGMLIGNFGMFLLVYLLGVVLSSVLMYFLICLPVYVGILPAEFFDYYSTIFREYALNYVAKSWIIAPFVLFLFIGILGVFTRDLLMFD